MNLDKLSLLLEFRGDYDGIIDPLGIADVCASLSDNFRTVKRLKIKRDAAKQLRVKGKAKSSRTGFQPTDRRARGEGGDDLEGRMALSGISTADLICRLQAIQTYRASFKGTLTEAARTWYREVCVPILGCLVHHQGGNVDKFVAKWGNVSSSTFRRSRCSGLEGESCVTEAVEGFPS
jgi:hypothetical protein